ncbi:hypothetical protein EON63_12680 [archaeon]|nr:MAG: hypothetical protein EON63_12680 [archaeon]
MHHNVSELHKKHAQELQRKEEDIHSLHTQLDTQTHTHTQLHTQLQALSQTHTQGQEVHTHMHRSMCRTYEAYTHTLVCLMCMCMYVQQVDERSGMVEECVGVYKQLYRQYEHTHKQLVYLVEGILPTLSRSPPSLKSIAIVVLASNRLLALGKGRRERKERREVMVRVLKQNLHIPSPAPESIEDVMSSYTLPPIEEVSGVGGEAGDVFVQGEVMAHYLPHFLAAHTHAQTNADDVHGDAQSRTHVHTHSRAYIHASKSSSLLSFISTKPTNDTYTQHTHTVVHTRKNKSMGVYGASAVMQHVHHQLLSAREQMRAHEQTMVQMKVVVIVDLRVHVPCTNHCRYYHFVSRSVKPV